MPGVTAWPVVQGVHVDPGPHSLPVASPASGPSTWEIWSPDLPWTGIVGDSFVLPALTVGGVLVTVTSLMIWNRVIDRSRTSLGSTDRLPGRSRISLAFAGLGIASLGGWVLRGGAQSSPLLYFGGIGLFAALLAWLLLPARTIPPVVAEGLHKALVSTAGGHSGADGAPRTAVYSPGADVTDPMDVRVSPSRSAIFDAGSNGTAVGSDDRFQSRPSGAVLYEAFRSEATADVVTESETFAWQLCQALTDWFQLVSRATPAVDDSGEITFHVAETSIPDVEMFDHPVVSFLGVALACSRERPVITTVQPGDASSGEYRISVHPFTADSPETPILNNATRSGSHDDTLKR